MGGFVSSAAMTPRRFERNARLFGHEAVERLARSHVIIFGLGGVGSWAAEGLARAGVGALTLVDFDKICATNVNRQAPATMDAIGAFKADVMLERLRRINPAGSFEAVREFYREENAEELLPAAGGVDFVVDAIDNVKAKMHLLARCLSLKLPVISSMGASGRLDPTKVRVSDLFDTHTDQFAKDVRKFLRLKHGVPATTERLGILAVWSTERPREPFEAECEEECRRCADCASGRNEFHSADRRRQIGGSAGFVTGVFGMMAAGVVARRLAGLDG